MSEDEQIPFNNRTHDRLTELEESRDILLRFKDEAKRIMVLMNEEIKELKKKTDFKLLTGLAGDQATKINKNIDEIQSLKEQIKSLEKGERILVLDTHNNKKVLLKIRDIINEGLGKNDNK